MAIGEGIRFQPWIGRLYNEGFNGIQLLILGESHYISSNYDDVLDFTIRVVDWHAITNGRNRFFTKAAKAITGSGWLAPEAKADFWQRVAFYNYIQESVGEAARIRPTPEMWEKAKTPFIEVLNILSPECILVLGQELWRNLPPGEAYSGLILGDHNLESRVYRTATDNPILASYIVHPSGRGFQYSEVRPRVNALLAEAQQCFDWR